MENNERCSIQNQEDFRRGELRRMMKRPLKAAVDAQRSVSQHTVRTTTLHEYEQALASSGHSQKLPRCLYRQVREDVFIHGVLPFLPGRDVVLRIAPLSSAYRGAAMRSTGAWAQWVCPPLSVHALLVLARASTAWRDIVNEDEAMWGRHGRVARMGSLMPGDLAAMVELFGEERIAEIPFMLDGPLLPSDPVSCLGRVVVHGSVDVEGTTELLNQLLAAKGPVRSLTAPYVSDEALAIFVQHNPQLTDLDISGYMCRTPLHGWSMTEPNLHLTDIGVLEVARCCRGLTSLNVSDTGGRITNAVITAVAMACPQLQSLKLQNAQGAIDQGSLMVVVDCCQGLTCLDISRNAKADWIPETMDVVPQKCPQMVELILSSFDCQITDRHLTVIAQVCGSLERLEVSGFGVGDTGLMAIAEGCSHMRALDVSYTHVTDAALVKCVQAWPELRELRAEPMATDEVLLTVAASCPRMEWLAVGNHFDRPGSPNVTDIGLVAVATACPHLLRLDVAATDVTDVGIIEIVRRCRKLQVLDVQNTAGRVTSRAMLEVARCCCDLRALDISTTLGAIDSSSMLAVATHCKRLEFISCTSARIENAVVEMLVENSILSIHGDILANVSLLSAGVRKT